MAKFDNNDDSVVVIIGSGAGGGTLAISPAAIERSDTCAVTAAGVVGEAMVAIVLAEAALEKFGGDSMPEILDNLSRYRARTAARFART